MRGRAAAPAAPGAAGGGAGGVLAGAEHRVPRRGGAGARAPVPHRHHQRLQGQWRIESSQ